jgi:queuine tRNA-ribosyltransferase
MLAAVQNFIPVVTSEAGLCLTAENWKEAKVTAIAYSVEFLLHKPGPAVLKKVTDLSQYLGWSGALILNAASLKANREGTYHLKSPYDGSKTKLTSLEFVELMHHLKPDAVILPKNILQDCPQIWENWNDSIMPFIHAEDLQGQYIANPHGVYFSDFNESMLEQVDQWTHLPCYVMGAIDAELIRRLRTQGVPFIETNEPASAAFHGRVYSQAGEVDLTNKITEMQFETIDPDCVCPSCSQQFTKAYFHHLLHHTPLLCQRFLIQHNVFWMAN